jgi:arginyl-tRNA synthetase
MPADRRRLSLVFAGNMFPRSLLFCSLRSQEVSFPMNLLSLIRQRFAPALQELVADAAPLLEMIRPAQDARFGDFQANFAMPLAKQLGQAPRDVARQVVERLDLTDLCEPPEIAGPGFINLRLRTHFLATQIQLIAGDDRLGYQPVAAPRHVVVDFSSPNVAKPMHVGHLRSTVIGDAICRTLRFVGHRVTSDNHIGDWGTQFGMIIYGYRHFRDQAAWQLSPVNELARLYKLVNQLSDYHATVAKLPALQQALTDAQSRLERLKNEPTAPDKLAKQVITAGKEVTAANSDLAAATASVQRIQQTPELLALANAHPDIARRARDETARLHAGDPENNALWNQFLPACLEALNQIYRRLGITFDLTLGESYYNPMLADVVSSLKARQLATLSEGATCVFLEGNAAPFIVQKTDGAYTYATTDLATIQYRQQSLKADEVLYVVDKRQSEHFQQLFATTALWGIQGLKLQHVSFGTVMGTDNKPYKTRAGDTVGLESLLDEAINRARRIVDENDDRREVPLLSPEERARIAEIVGLGGIKYADLHHSRDSDYVFDWDKMLATTGDTATYMQYAYARVCGIFRKLQIDRLSFSTQNVAVQLQTPEERRLALQLLMFGYAVESVLNDYRPHLLTAWLFDTADAFSQFFDKCSVQNAESDELRNSRLILCDLMARAIRTGLSLLGIEVSDIL